ncbi:uncharacterized protein L969DRAFT_364355 [Mixia osmundae IAM 14324]|uniref:Ribosomal RNA-processing protein 7 C-terminal domain-containing protein n=1 Tax=Mixia osmundae (strain CBS 9802 / IAM 14324 / JCM 22182 / KY 12970) TaxID=764103 RepID=G7DU24_MIXOS|nr:uncharacterized protein L969DRAFT_364355 [Mixia osmundae IAM 14324]KEI40951.1 hypothetical protein L969DRAFT_364355 [Mixia osmundae IAM 14324]GAA94084.1 hypothetical protein E5Q_00731 [Mixia osmundae IAM 14324]
MAPLPTSKKERKASMVKRGKQRASEPAPGEEEEGEEDTLLIPAMRSQSVAHSGSKRRKRQTTAAGFVPLPFSLAMPPIYALSDEPTTSKEPIRIDDPAPHWIFIRPSMSLKDTLSEDDRQDEGKLVRSRSLLVCNLPLCSTPTELSRALQSLYQAHAQQAGTTPRHASSLIKSVNMGQDRYTRSGWPNVLNEVYDASIPPLFQLDDDQRARIRPTTTADVIFTSRDALADFHKLASTVALDSTGQPVELVPQWPDLDADGPKQAWGLPAHHLLRPSFESVKKHTDAYMVHFESRPTSAKAAPEAESFVDPELEQAEPDDDGWTTVVRGGRHGRSADLIPTAAPPFSSKQKAGKTSLQDEKARLERLKNQASGYASGKASVAVASKSFQDKLRYDISLLPGQLGKEPPQELAKKPKRTENSTGFYRFERDANRKSSLQTLRHRFDRDKSKVEAMRKDRRFRPY